MTKAKNVSHLEQADLAAFCSHFLNISPRPIRRKPDGKIIFEFQTDVAPAIEAFYRNELVPIADYCQRLKHVRGMIFTMRGGGGVNGRSE